MKWNGMFSCQINSNRIEQRLNTIQKTIAGCSNKLCCVMLYFAPTGSTASTYEKENTLRNTSWVDGWFRNFNYKNVIIFPIIPLSSKVFRG